MHLAFVDKSAKDNNGVKYLLVRQDILTERWMQTKDPKETVKTFFQKDYKTESTKKIWVDHCTEFAGDFKKFCVAEGIHVYFTMSETKETFAEKTIRSLKNILYRYTEKHGYKNLHKLSQFVKILNSRKNLKILHT